MVLETNGKMGKGIALDHDSDDLIKLTELFKSKGFDVVDNVEKYDKDTFYVSYHKISDLPNVYTLKRAYIPYYYYLDSMGYSGWSEVCNMEIPKVEVTKNKIQEYLDNKVSKYKQNGEFNLDKPFVFVPLQIESDEVSKLGWMSSYELAQMCVNRFDTVVVKPHPGGNQKAPKGAIETHASIHSILPKADKVCTVNSGVGFEALMYGKPVYVAGESDYMRVCNIVKEEADFDKEGVYDVENFLHYMLNYQFLHINDQDNIDYHFNGKR